MNFLRKLLVIAKNAIVRKPFLRMVFNPVRRVYKFFLAKNPGVLKITSFPQNFHQKNTTKKICYFASFSRTSIIPKYVIRYLQEIHSNGFDIVFITTSAAIPPEELDKLETLAVRVVWRKNIGHDFGSYKAGLLHIDIDFLGYDQILLANDSCYGPFYPLSHVFKKMDRLDYDAWGMTDNYSPYHIMSFFLVINKSVFLESGFRKFWEDVVMIPTQDKMSIIIKYEIGFSQHLRAMGKRIGAFCPYEKLMEIPEESLFDEHESIRTYRRNHFCPSVYFYWRELITYMRMPFLKADILAKNPTTGWNSDWPQIIKKTGYPVELIWDNLKS